jgi:hypothetical protein
MLAAIHLPLTFGIRGLNSNRAETYAKAEKLHWQAFWLSTFFPSETSPISHSAYQLDSNSNSPKRVAIA